MNPRYLKVFRSHRILFLLPVAVAATLALWTALAAPTMYRSSVTLWSDTAGGSGSWLSGSLTPAGHDQQLLNELLSTRYFQDRVAHASPLQRYVETHRAEGWGPTALAARLRSAPSLDARIAAALDRTKVNARSPHVLEVTFDAPTPRLAMVTLDVIVKEYVKQRGVFRQDLLADAKKTVTEASGTLSAARTNLTSYLATHPKSTTRNDAELKELATSERMAVDALANATEAVNGAATSLTGSTSQTAVRVVDAPRLPSGPTRSTKQLLIALLAGLFAGAVVSIVAIVAVAKVGAGRNGLYESDVASGLVPDEDSERHAGRRVESAAGSPRIETSAP